MIDRGEALIDQQCRSNHRFLYSALIILFFGMVIAVRVYISMTRPLILTFYDESYYLSQAVGIAQTGNLPPLSWGPGIALFHLPIYLLFQNDALALDDTGRLGALIGGVAISFFVFLSSRVYIGRYWSLLALMLLICGYPFWIIDRNSSDLLYALVVSIVILIAARIHWDALHTQRKYLWVLSLLLSASVTIRNDGIIVYSALTILIGVWLFRGRYGSWPQIIRLFLYSWILPAAAFLGIVWLIYYIQGGSFNTRVWQITSNLSLANRTYLAFEQGEGWARRFDLQAHNKNWWTDGILVAREIYGTPQDNQSSVWRAIARNPQAQLQRIGWNIRDFFLAWDEAYKGRGLPIFMLSIWGMADLMIYRRRFALVLGALLLPTVTYFLITFWNYRYIASLAPLWVFVSVYALSIQSRHTYSALQALFISTIMGIVVLGHFWVSYYYSTDYGFSSFGVWICHLSVGFGVFIWAFFILKQLRLRHFYDSRLKYGLAAITLLLVTVLFTGVPAPASTAADRFTEYILFGFANTRGEHICFQSQDIASLSLIWYARQIPVEVRSQSLDQLVESLDAGKCAYILYIGPTNTPPLNTLTPVFTSSDQSITLLGIADG